MMPSNDPLVFACMAGDLSLVKNRLSSCDDTNYIHPKRGTALFQAAIGGHNEIVDYLIENGSDPNIVCPQWECNAVDAIVKQVNYKPATMLRLLLAGGRPVDVKVLPGPRIIKQVRQLSWYGLDQSIDTAGAWYDAGLMTFVQYQHVNLDEVGGLIKMENMGMDYGLVLIDGSQLLMNIEENPGQLSNGKKSSGYLEIECVNLLY